MSVGSIITNTQLFYQSLLFIMLHKTEKWKSENWLSWQAQRMRMKKRVKPKCSKWISTKIHRMKGENRGRRKGETVNTLILCSLWSKHCQARSQIPSFTLVSWRVWYLVFNIHENCWKYECFRTPYQNTCTIYLSMVSSRKILNTDKKLLLMLPPKTWTKSFCLLPYFYCLGLSQISNMLFIFQATSKIGQKKWDHSIP